MTISNHDRDVIESHLYRLANNVAIQARASLNLARETVREAAIEYAVRTGLDDAKAVELARDLIEHVEWGVRCHFVEYKPETYVP